jgi:hypothetical protein
MPLARALMPDTTEKVVAVTVVRAVLAMVTAAARLTNGSVPTGVSLD